MDTGSSSTTTTTTTSGRPFTSLAVFRSFIRRSTPLDCFGVISRECFVQWMTAKHAAAAAEVEEESDAQAHKFRRALICHLSGTDGRYPFEPDEEAGILALLRGVNAWPCFPPHLAHHGTRYRAKGFHEKLRASAAAKRQRPRLPPPPPPPTSQRDPMTNVRQLTPEAATMVTNFGERIVRDFARAFSAQDRLEIYELLRYTVLSIPKACALDSPERANAAQRLCNNYAARLDGGVVVMVFDMTSRHQSQCLLAQSPSSVAVMGNLVGAYETTNHWQREDLFRTMVAFGSAYLAPGTMFELRSQRVVVPGTASVVLIDTQMVVDPQSFLLVCVSTVAAAAFSATA